uniref:Putative ovule protein n=1 Tax=Solanum chacoense TaxID=4108 RepID=A0A0V0IG62_SOLCH
MKIYRVQIPKIVRENLKTNHFSKFTSHPPNFIKYSIAYTTNDPIAFSFWGMGLRGFCGGVFVLNNFYFFMAKINKTVPLNRWGRCPQEAIGVACRAINIGICSVHP